MNTTTWTTLPTLELYPDGVLSLIRSADGLGRSIAESYLALGEAA